MSKVDLAVKADISTTMITYIENGSRSPSLANLLKICNALNINPCALFDDTSAEKEEQKKSIMMQIEKLLS